MQVSVELSFLFLNKYNKSYTLSTSLNRDRYFLLVCKCFQNIWIVAVKSDLRQILCIRYYQQLSFTVPCILDFIFFINSFPLLKMQVEFLRER